MGHGFHMGVGHGFHMGMGHGSHIMQASADETYRRKGFHDTSRLFGVGIRDLPEVR